MNQVGASGEWSGEPKDRLALFARSLETEVRDLRAQLAGELVALELEGGADDLVEVDENAPGLVTLAEDGERAHAPGCALPLLFDDAGVAVGVLEARAHPDHGAARDQRGQRIGDFMGDIGEESAQRHHPVARDENPPLAGQLRAEIADLGLKGPRKERQPVLGLS